VASRTTARRGRHSVVDVIAHDRPMRTTPTLEPRSHRALRIGLSRLAGFLLLAMTIVVVSAALASSRSASPVPLSTSAAHAPMVYPGAEPEPESAAVVSTRVSPGDAK
jgi:hypothetical protein